MFWNWFGFRNPDRGRFVFAYKDGTRDRRADPVAVERALTAALGDDWRGVVRKLSRPASAMGLVGEQADAENAEWEATRVKVLTAVCAAFGVSTYSDGGGVGRPSGLTEVELWGLLEGYVRFCTDLVELAAPFGNARSRASPSPAARPPANGSGFTCPATPSPPAAPPKSPA